MSFMSNDESKSRASNSNEEDQNRVPLTISWNKLLEGFLGSFRAATSEGNIKARLDATKIVVDGAKDKWQSIVLLDTIVSLYYQYFENRTSIDSLRRKFDQYKTFRTGIVDVCAEMIAKSYQSQETIEYPPNVVLIDIPSNWMTIDAFLADINDDKTYKSWNKRIAASETLKSLIEATASGFIQMITAVVNKIYADVRSC